MKPLQIGARITFHVVQYIQQAVQGLTSRNAFDERPRAQETAPEPRPRPRQRKPAAPRKPKPLDDATITHKVETVLFRDDSVEKGKIDVNTADAVVWLRGEAKSPEQIKELEATALAIPEVKQVENLLHLPKTPAPTRADTPLSQQKTRRHKATAAAAARKPAPKRTTSERKTSGANGEPTPKELAESGKGRRPAPLGAEGAGPAEGS
jgi:hypothetical protein